MSDRLSSHPDDGRVWLYDEAGDRLVGIRRPRRRVSWGHAPEVPWSELDLEDRVRYVLVVLGLLAVLVLAGLAGGAPA